MRRTNVIYTRFSSEMQRNESCDDQEREVRRGLSLKGIDPCDFEVMHDRAESGTKNDRAKFEELCGMIRRGEVGILAVDDQARFSRSDNAFSFIKDLVFSGGRFLSTGEGIDTHQEGWELRVKVMELHNSTTIRELGRRVRRGQAGRVLEDGSAGDIRFGFESFYLDPNWFEVSSRGPKPKKGIRIKESEAVWVRQVFRWFVDEQRSINWIARELTRLGVDNGHEATASGWHHERVKRMLASPKYIGQWRWGETLTVRNSSGKTKKIPVPEGEEIDRDRPNLRIIDQKTWDKAQERLEELEVLYGKKPGQKPRGPKPHHTDAYPKSLLGGLLYCHSCGTRLWSQGGGGRGYLGCPNQTKGLCNMTGQVPIAKAEEKLVGFVSQILRGWPEWMETAVATMHQSLEEAAAAVPQSLKTDSENLAVLMKRMNTLVDQLADGAPDSPTIRQRLHKMEREAESLRARIEQADALQKSTFTVPTQAWIQERMANLLPEFQKDPAACSRLLRRLLGRVTAEPVIARGKKRGFMRLHLHISASQVLVEVLGDDFPNWVVGPDASAPAGEVTNFQLDLGEQTRYDVLAPQIVEMRSRKVPWKDIASETGLSLGNAYNIWKRWSDGESQDQSESA